MSWQASVDRVLELRRIHQLEQEKARLIAILQQLEERTRSVVNRRLDPVLQGVPSWRDPQPAEKRPVKMARIGGLRTWADKRRELEKQLRAETDRLRRRAREFEQVLSGELPAPVKPVEVTEVKFTRVTTVSAQPGAAVPPNSDKEQSDGEQQSEQSEAV